MKQIAILVAVMAIALAACGGADDAGVASLDASTSTQAQTQDGGSSDATGEEDALLEFSACMRENGVEDFEDPTINADGSVEFGVIDSETEGGLPDDAEIEKLEAAFAVCGDRLDGVAFGGDGSFDLTELEDSFVEFSACMRDKGIDIDDPDFSSLSGPSGIIDIFSDIDITDPEVQDALEECQEIFADFAPGGGG